jgi:hypothetical protein
MPKKPKPTHGGPRANSGRPVETDPRHAFPLRLRADPAARVRAEAERQADTLGKRITPADVVEGYAMTLPRAPHTAAERRV